MPALVGGGLRARPGEISLSHNGVLFLDELPEFSGQVLNSLRRPLETGEVAIARANHRITYPARFMLVAAINPCRCGRASDSGFFCKRGANERCAAEYQSRLSGPLLDRIDLHVEVPGVTAADLILPAPAEGSREVAARVAGARDIQAARYATMGLESVRTNAQVSGPVLEDVARLDSAGLSLLRAHGFDAIIRARISSGVASRADARRSGRSRFSWPCPPRGGTFLSGTCGQFSPRRVVRPIVRAQTRAINNAFTTFTRTAGTRLIENKFARFPAPNGLRSRAVDTSDREPRDAVTMQGAGFHIASYVFAASTLVTGILATFIYTRYRAAKNRQRMLEDRIEELSDRIWEVREAEERARSLLEAQGDIIVRRDSSSRITYANDAFCRLAGKPRDV